jgi:hypothetical protein
MIPKNILKHTVTITLREYDEIEMILLKGHLIIEQSLNHLLAANKIDMKRIDSMGLMFAKKLELIMALEVKFIENEYLQLKEINRIRNKLAHELFFKDYHMDLKNWACSVLGYTPKKYKFKKNIQESCD